MNAARSIFLAATLWAAASAVYSASPWSWFQAGTEIRDPCFSPDGTEIAFALKRHEMDGAEAEGMPEDQIAKYRAEHKAAIRNNPRAFDPFVKILSLKTGRLQPVGFGYEPAFSPDGQQIAFQFQKQPISGLRELTSTLAGNEIQLFDRRTGSVRAVVTPVERHVAHPVFSPDGRSLAFTYEDNMNGAYSGPVGVGKLDLASQQVSRLYAPRRAHGLPHIVNQFGYVGDTLYALVSIPQDSAAYMANKYLVQLFSLVPREEVRYSWGIRGFGEGEPAFGQWRDRSPAVFSGTWQPLAGARATQGSSRKPGVLSPNGRWVAREFASGIVITDAATGEKLAEFEGPRSNDPETRKEGESGDDTLDGITWSHDSRRIAWVEIIGYYTWDNEPLKVATFTPPATSRRSSTR